MEIALWLLFCVPGLVYSIWRLTTRCRVCEICAAPALIPAHTPAAQQILNRAKR